MGSTVLEMSSACLRVAKSRDIRELLLPIFKMLDLRAGNSVGVHVVLCKLQEGWFG